MGNELTKKYGLFTAIAMVVGIVIGSGVFFKAQAILEKTQGNMTLGILAWVIGAFVMIVCAYCFATMATKYEKVNGLVDYSEATCGKGYAYYMGWFVTTIYYPAMTSVLAWVSARYTLEIFGMMDPTTGTCLALAGLYLVLSYGLNALSPVLAGKFQVSATVIKLIPLVLMAVVGTIFGLTVTPEGAAAPQLVENFAAPGGGVDTLFGACVATVFAYEGWIIATSINSEIKDAKKNLPIALLLGTAIIAVIYIAYYIGVAGGASVESLRNDGAQIAFLNIFGGVFGTILKVFIAISCLGTLNGLMVGSTRGLYALSARKDGPRPDMFGNVDKTTNMPTNAAVFGLLVTAFWLFYFFAANLGGLFTATYDAESANAFIRLIGTLKEVPVSVTETCNACGNAIQQVVTACEGCGAALEVPMKAVYEVNWFGFDSSEIPIITVYAMYLPIFIKMFTFKEFGVFKRIIMPALAIIGSLFMVFATIYSHKWGVAFYLIVYIVIMLIGKAFRQKNA